MEKEKEKQKQGPDPLPLALSCYRASLLLSSLRQPPATPTTTTRRSSTSSSEEFELRSAHLLDAELAVARREAAGFARMSGADLLLVISLVPLLFVFVGLLAAAAAEAAA